MKTAIIAAMMSVTPVFAEEARDLEFNEAYFDCMSEPGEVSDANGILAACRAVIEAMDAKGPALAVTPEEAHINHVACLVGSAAGALVKQKGPKDAEAALMTAVQMCPGRPAGQDENFEYGEMVTPIIEEIAKIEGL